MSSAGPGLPDWDEARVDYTDLDLADLPDSGLPPARLSAARRQLALPGPPPGLSAVRPPRQTRPGR
jgi:hypothetical protein